MARNQQQEHEQGLEKLAALYNTKALTTDWEPSKLFLNPEDWHGLISKSQAAVKQAQEKLSGAPEKSKKAAPG